MSNKDVARAKGRLDGIRESGWTCGDCGNTYDATVDSCPNRLLDEALVDLGRVKARRRVWKAAGEVGGEQLNSQDAPEVKDTVVAERAPGRLGTAGKHLTDCPCTAGSCCSWVPDCTCQCRCDFIARIEERVRAEYDPSESDADEGYRQGYSTAVAEFLGNHGDDATYQLGYNKALQDVIEKARREPGVKFTTVEELMNDLNDETS